MKKNTLSRFGSLIFAASVALTAAPAAAEQHGSGDAKRGSGHGWNDRNNQWDRDHGPRDRRYSNRGGHWETYTIRVWVPAQWQKTWVPPVVKIVIVRDHLGLPHPRPQVVREGYWENQRVPGYYRTEFQRRWVEHRR